MATACESLIDSRLRVHAGPQLREREKRSVHAHISLCSPPNLCISYSYLIVGGDKEMRVNASQRICATHASSLDLIKRKDKKNRDLLRSRLGVRPAHNSLGIDCPDTRPRSIFVSCERVCRVCARHWTVNLFFLYIVDTDTAERTEIYCSAVSNVSTCKKKERKA